ncbi:MAG: hypothetical protein ACRDDZ_09425 [Marinifilaceae bacterium]
MAIIKGPLSDMDGRLQNVTTYKRLGQTVMRAIPLKVKHPNTDKQLQCRCRLMLTSRLAKWFEPAAAYGLMRRDEGQSVRTQFSRTNAPVLGREVYTPGQVPWQALSLSRGDLAVPYVKFYYSLEAMALNVELLSQATGVFTQPDDMVMVCVVQPSVLEAECPDKSDEESWMEFYKRYKHCSYGSMPLVGGMVERIAGRRLTIERIACQPGETLWVYYFAYNERTKEASVTQVVRVVAE